jgi:hypothetical protein
MAFCTRPEFAADLPLNTSLVPAAYGHTLAIPCGCGIAHGTAPRLGPPFAPRPESLPIAVRDRIYTLAFGVLSLRREARDDLIRRGLNEQAIAQPGFRSVPRNRTEKTALLDAVRHDFDEETLQRCPGFHDKNGRIAFSPNVQDDGYIVPYVDALGRITGFQVKVLGGRYYTPRGTRYATVHSVAGERSDTLFAVEGGLKAIVTAAVGGLWCFGVAGQTLLPEHVEAISALRPTRVAVALDREVNVQTAKLRERWMADLSSAGLEVYEAVWDG